LTAYSFRNRAGLVSCRQRSWDFALRSVPLSQGTRRVSAPGEPTCRFSERFRQHRSTGPSRSAAAPGLRPFRESLAPDLCLADRNAGCSPGLHPFQGIPARTSTEIPLGLLSHASPTSPGGLVGRRLRVSIGSRFASPTPDGEPPKLGEATLLGFPHRSAPEHLEGDPLGLCVHLAPCRASLPTTSAL
jgi:hypothetical protein